mgnify:CR=1 FL=1
MEEIIPDGNQMPIFSDKIISIFSDLDKYNEEATVMVIHAGLECGIIQSNVEHKLDIVSFGPTITGAHSPDEAVEIKSVGKSYDYLISVIENLK